MGNITQQFVPGTPSVSVRWPKGTIVKTEIVKNSDGRFICRVKVNDSEFFALPGSHPTETDAEHTLNAYIEENSSNE